MEMQTDMKSASSTKSCSNHAQIDGIVVAATIAIHCFTVYVSVIFNKD